MLVSSIWIILSIILAQATLLCYDDVKIDEWPYLEYFSISKLLTIFSIAILFYYELIGYCFIL